jgi:pseudo-rSAM protein
LNNRTNKKYWFYIDSFVHISMKHGDVLYYNTYSGKIAEFAAETNGDLVLKLTRRLASPKNLRVIRLTSRDLENPVISNFVHIIREHFMGDLIDADLSDTKPFQVAPTRAKVHFDVKKVVKDPDQSPGKVMMNNVSEITLYLNDTCPQQCEQCAGFYKQGIWCRRGASRSGHACGHHLDISLLKNFFHDIKGCNLNNINFTGGSVWLYPHLDELCHLLESVDFRVQFLIHYLNIDDNLEPLDQMKKNGFKIRLMANFPLAIDRFKKALEQLSGYGLNVQPVFFVQSDEEYSLVAEMLSGYPGESPVFLPYYNENNLDFFKKNFFISREDIENRKPEQRVIHGNSKINMDNFGKITIFADRRVHANVMDPPLGTLGKDSIYDCVYRELNTGRSWFRVRKNVRPCKSCNFELLCPPLSNYNRVIGRNDLCTIWPGNSIKQSEPIFPVLCHRRRKHNNI